MSMFPTDVDVSTVATETIQNLKTASIGRSLKFDYSTNTFIIVDGKNIEPSKIDSIKQWVELYIRTETGKYKVYTNEFGVDLGGLVGYRLPRGLQIAEIMRRINSGILNKCPNVKNVSDWEFEKGTFSFVITTDTGEEITING